LSIRGSANATCNEADEPFYRTVTYFLAFVLFASAAILPLIDLVAQGGLYVQFALPAGLAFVALGLWRATFDEQPPT
jgi:hypothetical protein